MRAPAGNECPSPEEARAKMTVPDGYAVRCFAHEPMVANPVAMTWDAHGRLWVVEAYEYPSGTPLPAAQRPFGGDVKDAEYHPMPKLAEAHPQDRVIILEDTDGDGVADKRTVFVDGLNLASAILCGDDGIYVGQHPSLLHFRDADHDDKPDDWRVVLTGFGRADTHELMNSFCWGPDGWLYMTQGVFTSSAVRRPGLPESSGFKWDAGIGRCRPRTGEFEVFADGTSNPWGCDFDERGNFFVSACVIDHFFHMAPGGIYARQGGAPQNPYSYGLLPSIVTHQHFRAAYAGIQIYQGGVYPQDTWGHAFIGNIHDNAIHEEVLTPVGATFKCEPRRDFLRANDGWFRPVSTRTGPDGNLWVMDWCDKYPCYQNALANPAGVDREKGRIWRVVYTGEKAATPLAKPLPECSDAELVARLGDANSWVRRSARQLIGERHVTKKLDAPTLPALRDLLSSARVSTTRLEALWTLHECEAIAPELASLSRDADPRIRQWSARLLGEAAARDGAKIQASDFEMLTRLASDEDAQVQAAVATALRQMTARWLTVDRDLKDRALSAESRASAWDAVAAVIRKSANAQELPMQHAVWMAIEPLLAAQPKESLEKLAVLAPTAEPVSHGLIYKAMRRLCDTGDLKSIDLAFEFATHLKGSEALTAQALAGLVKGQESKALRPSVEIAAGLSAWAASGKAEIRRHAQTLGVMWGDAQAVASLIALFADGNADVEKRIEALAAMRKLRSDAAKAAYGKLWRAKTPGGRFFTEALRAAPDLGDDDTAKHFISLWPSMNSAERVAATDALMARQAWARDFLQAIADKQIALATLPPTAARNFATNPDPALRQRAAELLGVWRESDADTKALIAAKRKVCLQGEPDIEKGREVFQATCSVCHAFHGGGQKVGPELIGSGRSNLDALLANVIDPNQIIGNGYENIIVTTKDGRTLAGRVTEDTPSQVKLLMIGGQESVIARGEVATLVNTHQSLMPTGFGGLPDDTFRNLIWYVLAPPEEGPLTPEKRKQLSASIDAPAAALKEPSIDWESVSLWNPEWKVVAPEFERTPVKLPEFHGRKNVLLLHPFPDREKPAALERKMKVDEARSKLKFSVAADDRGDWRLAVKVDGREVRRLDVKHDEPRWKEIAIDLSESAGKEVTIRLESHATGWSYEFAYWSDVRLEP